MPRWGELIKEIKKLVENGEKAPYDLIRRKYLLKLFEYTKRPTIVYASAWTNGKSGHVSIDEGDRKGFMEAINGLKSDQLDLIIHSPGGSAEETERIVKYLREKFNHIRAIIPYSAMSAATMLACSADEIIMAKHSYMGPIDPQVSIVGKGFIPAQAILDEFEQAKKEILTNPETMRVWVPLLQPIAGKGILKVCENLIELSRDLVKEWLKNYMFKEEPDATTKSEKIAEYLSDHNNFKTHGRGLNYKDLSRLGLKIQLLEDDQNLQDRVLSVFHAYDLTFDKTDAVKIIENHKGKARITMQRETSMFLPPMVPFSPLKPEVNKPLPSKKSPKKRPKKRKNNLLFLFFLLDLYLKRIHVVRGVGFEPTNSYENGLLLIG